MTERTIYESDFYLSYESTQRLEDLAGDDDLGDWVERLASKHGLKLPVCYIRDNTRYDPPNGSTILRVGLEGPEEGIKEFARDLLHHVL